MRGNTFGKLFSITTFGESHGVALGVIIDGVPAGLTFKAQELQAQLNRRRPGRLKETTARDEADQFEVLSGIFEEKTLGTPISIIVRNTNQRSQDYSKDMYRPGHADKTTELKFGHRDYRGGGRASGRETLTRVIGGYFAQCILKETKAIAKITQLGEKQFKKDTNFTKLASSQLGLSEESKENEVSQYLLDLKADGNSIGGKVTLKIYDCPPALGEPVFDKLKADLAKAMLSIGSCIGIEFGIGNDFTLKTGKEITADQANFGGIEGGISNGETIELTLSFRPPSTVGQKAKEGRHDPCILPRVLPVVESMALIVLADHFLRQNAYQINHSSF